MTQQKQRQQEPQNITEMKRSCCNKLTEVFSNDLMQKRLRGMVGGDESRVAKNFAAFLAEIMSDDGGNKDNRKYLAQCTISSLTMCFLESMNMQLPFDSRKLVSLVIYANQATGFLEAELDISYKGFINALNKHYANAYVDAKLVWEDDLFEYEEADRKASYKFKPAKGFRTVTKDFKGIAGGFCYFSYTTANGEPISRLVMMSKDDILHIKSKAKTKYVWDDFPSEMGIKALIRRGAKIPFAAIDLDMDIEEVANKHYELDKPSTSSENRIALLRAAQAGINDPEPKPEPEEEKKPEDESGEKVDGSQDTVPFNEVETQPTTIDGDTPPAVQEISDADFEEVPNATPAPAPSNTAAPQPASQPSSGAPIWDGKTIYMGDGKQTSKEFSSSVQAMVYLKKVISTRKHTKSRKEIIDGNSLLIGALIRDGRGAEVSELHKLADQGEA